MQSIRLLKRISISSIAIFIAVSIMAQQPRFSLATDLGGLRNFKKGQHFISLQQTIGGQFNFTPKEALYSSFSYSTNGRFHQTVTANAKDITTTPQDVTYVNFSRLRFTEISIGWKHYLKGSSDREDPWNLYGYGGFGLLSGVVQNSHSITLNQSTYALPVLSGKAKFKRLTIDLALGFETPLGGDIYFYSEGRVLLPTTNYPSPYLLVNDNTPLIGSVNMGVRLLF